MYVLDKSRVVLTSGVPGSSNGPVSRPAYISSCTMHWCAMMSAGGSLHVLGLRHTLTPCKVVLHYCRNSYYIKLVVLLCLRVIILLIESRQVPFALCNQCLNKELCTSHASTLVPAAFVALAI
jgi:hypothetical protein